MARKKKSPLEAAKRREKQKYNYNLARSMGYSPKQARKMRNSNPAKLYAKAAAKIGTKAEPPPEHLGSKAQNRRVKRGSKRDRTTDPDELLRYAVKDELGIPLYLTRKFDHEGLLNLVDNLRKIYEIGEAQGLSDKEIRRMIKAHLESKTEDGFWSAVRSVYEMNIGIRP